MQGQIRETSSNSRTCGNQANVLAEKNMRDSLAQREQAERTRLTETLVDDIRRWSSGKEGNLRALLSTLQYEKAEAFKMRVDDLKKKEMLRQIAPANALFHNNMLKWIVRAVEVPPEAE